MAKLSTYVKDNSISGEDLLVGSNYIGVDNYATNNFKIKDLADYFAGQITTDPLQLSLKPNGGLVFETINNGNYLAVDLSASNITGQLANSDLVNSSITINSTVVSLGGSIDIPVGDITNVIAGTYLNGGGETGEVTLNHDTTSRSDTTASSTITSTFTAITSITSNATGHITSEETTTYTLPTDIYVNSAAVTGTNTKTITLGRTGGQSNLTANFDDLDTTYSISALASGSNALVRLTAGGSGSGTDDVTLSAGPNINLSVTGDTIEIESTAFGNVYEAANITEHINLTTVQGDIVVRTDESKTYIDNGGPDATGASDLSDEYTELQFSGIQNINLTAADEIELSRTSLTQSNNDLTIGHLDVTRTNTTSTASPAHGGTFTAIDSLTSNARGHITAVNTKTITLPDDDDNYADTLNITGDTTKTVTIGRTGSLIDLTATFTDNDNYVDSITVTEPTSTTKRITIGRTGSLVDLTADFTDNNTIPNDATITLSAGTYISGGGDFTTDQSANETITFNHDNTTRTDTTSSVSPAHQASFTAIDTITTNATGHVTAVNTKTITLPSDDDDNTTYSISAENATGGANLRLTGVNPSSTDDVVYKGSGATTVTRTDANTITISSTDTKQATVWKVIDDDGDQVDIAHNKYLKFVSAVDTVAGTNLTGTGTSSNPYVMTITNPDTQPGNGTLTVQGTGALGGSGTFTANQSGNTEIYISHDDTSALNGTYGSTANNTKIDTITVDAYGHVTAIATGPIDDNNSIDYINSASFDTSDGILTLSGVGNAGASVDLDGRYLTSYTETDTLETVVSRGNTTGGTLEVTGTGAWLTVEGNTGGTNPPLNQGLAFGWNRSNGQNETEILFRSSTSGHNGRLDIKSYNGGSDYSDTLAQFKGNGTINFPNPGNIVAEDNGGERILQRSYNSATWARLVSNSVGGELQLGRSNSAYVKLVTLGDSYLNGGDVGIGTTNPGTKLDVNGVITATGGTSTNWNTAYGWGNHASAGYLTSFDITTQTDPKYLRSNADDTSSGSLTVVSYKFNGNASNPTNTTATIYDQSGVGLTASAHNFSIRNYNGSSMVESARFTTGSLTVIGDIVAYGSPSDISLKENIKPIKNALDKVEKLQGVTFDWKESDSILNIKEDIGFIAQDVQKVLPELVRENDNGKLSLRHQGIISVLAEAIKELSNRIKVLEDGSTK